MNKIAALNRPLRVLLWATILVGIALMSLGVRQVDFWWQLSDGLSILRTHHLPTAPAGAFGLPSQPFINEYSLYEIVLAVLYKIGAVHLAFIAVYLLVFALPLAPTLRAPRDLVSCALVALATIFMINRYEQRPEIVGVLLLAVLVRLLLRTNEFGPSFLLRIALIMAVWTNVHSSYLIGLLALGFWLVQQTFGKTGSPHWSPRQATTTLATASLAVLLSPYGWHRIAFTFAQQRDLGSNLLSREMWPAWDQPADVQALTLLTIATLTLALVSRQRPPLWLAALAIAACLLTIFNIRHMSFLAVALLFIAAPRRVIDPGPRWSPALTPLLAAACVATFLFDFVAARSAWSSIHQTPAQLQRMFAPALVKMAGDDNYGAILCHDAEGSYASFAAPGIHPLLDSGQGHFDDATKRFYFFTVQDPFAFDRALESLHVHGVLVTPPVGGWTLAMIHRPGWYLAGCDEQGLLFRRFAESDGTWGGVGALHGIDLITYRDRALAEHDFVRAFTFNALFESSVVPSLVILDRSERTAWSESFFSFTRAWIRSLHSGELESFVRGRGLPKNPLLREFFLARMHTDTALPPIGSSGLEHLARVLTLLERNERNDPAAARTLFRSIPPPKVSPLYYTLRARLFPELVKTESVSERWQDWTAGGSSLFNRQSPLLNARADALH